MEKRRDRSDLGLSNRIQVDLVLFCCPSARKSREALSRAIIRWGQKHGKAEIFRKILEIDANVNPRSRLLDMWIDHWDGHHRHIDPEDVLRFLRNLVRFGVKNGDIPETWDRVKQFLSNRSFYAHID
ncbi:MAG: hypothetical protein WC797_00395 [Candidatus Paceibacterota bacterium]|jgi:hypothetical protein